MDCTVDKFSSRVCERGTKSCIVHHLSNSYIAETSVEMLKYAMKELELLYCFAISNGMCEAETPPHEQIRKHLFDIKATYGGFKMKKIELMIECCRECPILYKEHYCAVIEEKISDINTFPENCPYDDEQYNDISQEVTK